MARYNKIYAGPFQHGKPSAREAIASVDLLPGRFVVLDGSGEFALAGAATVGQAFIVQDNYLALKDPDTAIAAGDRAVALEMIPTQLFYARVATGQNVAIGAALTFAANGELAIAGSADKVVAHADEAYNNTSGSGQLVRVRPAVGYMTAV